MVGSKVETKSVYFCLYGGLLKEYWRKPLKLEKIPKILPELKNGKYRENWTVIHLLQPIECQTVWSDHYIGPRGRKKSCGKTLSSLDCYMKELQLKQVKLANKIPYFPTWFFSPTWANIMIWSYNLVLYGLEKMD